MEALFTAADSPDEVHEADADDGESVDLYSCPDCDTTYIEDDMRSCPECGEAVERTPSFAELGIGPDGGE